jgi:hypothetical protein
MPERVLPREFSVPPEFLIPLSNAELQELGTFTAIWAQLDWIIMLVFCYVAKIETGPAHLIMENMTTGPRVGLLKKLCQADPKNDIKKSIAKICDDNGGLIEDRNHIIHGLWAIEWNYTTGRTTPACLFQKGGRKPIYAGKLAQLSDRAAKFSNELGALLAQLNPQFSRVQRAPHPFFFGAGTPTGHAPPPWPPE